MTIATKYDSGSKLRVPKAAELLAARIRGQIVRGELKAGDILPPEAELMEQFGVSRPTLREGFRILEVESLLSIRRGSRGGALITSPDPAVAARIVGVLLQLRGVTLADIHEARTMIEPVAARRVAGLRNVRKIVGSLRSLNEDARASADDFAAFPHLSWRFHQGLIEAAQNETLAVLVQMIADIVDLQLTRRYSRPMTPPEISEQVRRNLRSLNANEHLLTLLETRDEVATEEFWRKHLIAIGTTLLGSDSDQVIDLPH